MYKKPIIALAIMLGLLLVSNVVSRYYEFKVTKIDAETTLRNTEVARIEIRKNITTDSLTLLRTELGRLVKYTVAREAATQSTPPDEKEILSIYAAMDDSTAIRLFYANHGDNPMLSDGTDR